MPAFPAVIDLANLGSDGFTIIGDTPTDFAGYSVASAGDVNGDGFDDIIVGAMNHDSGGNFAGAAYVIFGKASGFGTIDLGALAAADGFKIQGDANYDMAGRSVASAGDVNGDGFDDILVGSFGNSSGGNNAGAAYLIFGKASGFATIDLGAPGGLAAADGIKIQGDYNYDMAGVSVSSAGDVNGDGYDDMLVGAMRNDPSGEAAGAAYVLFGKASGFTTIDLGHWNGLSPAVGFKIQGDADFDFAGLSLSSAGDVNGDGYDDVLVCALHHDSGGSAAGAAYVIFGKASGFGPIDLGALAPADGFKIQGDAAYDYAGRSVSSAGDVNGDGYDDILVGAPGNDSGGTGAGAAYVIFGKASGFGLVDLGAPGGLAADDGFRIQGDADYDYAGFSVSSAGDVNGDGYGDIIVGARRNDSGGTDAGAAYVIFGKASGFGTIDLGTPLTGTDGFKIQGAAAFDRAGYSVSAAGDVNGDGFDDILVGAIYNDWGGTDAGAAYVIFGHATAADSGPEGSDGNDMMTGSAGGDTMAGGLGNDVYMVDSMSDVVIELDGEGVDEVHTAVGSRALPDRLLYTIPEFVENLTGTAIGAQGVRDNALDNVINMGGGHDLVVADAGGVDTINGGAGNDFIYHGDKLTAADITDGGAGIDTIGLLGDYSAGIAFTAANLVGIERMALYGSVALPGSGPFSYDISLHDANVADGTEFFVTAASLGAAESLTFNGAAETGGRFTVHGGAGADTIVGGAGGDFFIGNAGNDSLYGRGGMDLLIGGLGADLLRGGAGSDRFVYQSAAQSTIGSIDHIVDFQHADRIDLSGIDAVAGAAGDQAFTFIGSAAFGNVAGQLRATSTANVWTIEGDTDGDGNADLVIQVTLLDPAPLGAGDFVL